MNPQSLSPEVQEALARRGMGGGQQPQAPQLSQGAPMQGQPAPSQMPMQMPAEQAPVAQGSAKPKFEPTNKDDFIISTLAEELKRSHDLKKEQMKFNAPSIM